MIKYAKSTEGLSIDSLRSLGVYLDNDNDKEKKKLGITIKRNIYRTLYCLNQCLLLPLQISNFFVVIQYIQIILIAPAIFYNKEYWSPYNLTYTIYWIAEILVDPLYLFKSSDFGFILFLTLLVVIIIIAMILFVELTINKSLIYNQYMVYITALMLHLIGSIFMIPYICIHF